MQTLSLTQQNQHLKGVSRTFALTIPLLPTDLRDWVGNAYLLCRIADTIEDDPKMSVEQKVTHLSRFIEMLSSPISLDEWTKEICKLTDESARIPEKILMHDIPLVVGRYYSYPSSIQQILRHGVTIMCRGMSQIDRWKKINTLEEVDDYCYSVAGVVGEILLYLFAEHSERINKELPEMKALAVSFGEALQLTNILKDVWDDSKRGVKWLPIPEENEDTKKLETRKYVSIAYGHALQALEFIKLIPRTEAGIRNFCLVAAEMCVLTLKNIYKKPLFKEPSEIKISHSDVRMILIITRLFSRSNLMLDFIFKKLGGTDMHPSFRSPEDLMKRVSFWDTTKKSEDQYK